MGPASRWPVEPEVDLARAHRILIIAIRTRGGGHRPFAERRHHHQVVPEPGLGAHLQELRHRGDHPGVVPGLQPPDPLQVRRAGPGGPDVHRVAGLVRAQFPQRPERVGHRAGGQEQDRAARLADGRAERPPRPQEVLGVAGLRRADRDPPLAEPAAEVVPQVDGGVVGGQARVIDGGDPGSVPVSLAGDGVREFRVTRPVVGDPGHAARQFVGREKPRPHRLGGHDELHGGVPVRVEHHDRVVVQRLEDLRAEPFQARDQADLLALVQFEPLGVRQHDRGDMSQQSRPGNLTHGCSIPVLRRRCS